MRHRTGRFALGAVSAALALASAAPAMAAVPGASSPGTATAPTFTGSCPAGAAGPLTASQLGGWNYMGTNASAARVQGVASPMSRTGCAIRVEVRQGDGGSASADRTEFAGTHTLWRNGDQVWYSLSFKIDAASPLPTSSTWELVHQFYAQDIQAKVSGGSPPVAIELTSAGTIRLTVRGGARASAGARAPRTDGYTIGPATRGVTHNLLLHVKWSTGSAGLVEVWERRADGSYTTAPQVYAPGVNVHTVGGRVLPVYAETGLYRSRMAASQVVYYGGLWARRTSAEAAALFTGQ